LVSASSIMRVGTSSSNHQELTIPIVNYKQRIIASKPAGASTSFSTPRKKRPQQKRHELVEAERHAVREIIDQLRKSELP
jgi:hypothetical protein